VRGSRTKSLSAQLVDLGVRCVFGLPGTQNLALFEDLRKSPLRTVPATSELAASFMAVGYARASGQPGVLVTIPGPGFTFALPGLAEARLDSVPLVHLVVHRPLPPGRRFRHQEIEHLKIARPLVKEVVRADGAVELRGAVERSWALAQDGEPGPVVLWISSEALGDTVGKGQGRGGSPEHPAEDGVQPDTARTPPRLSLESLSDPDEAVAALSARLSAAKRPVLFLGLGAVSGEEWPRTLVERLNAPFFTTASARGVIPEDHPLCLGFDFDRGGLDVLNALLGTSDLVLALGCKLGHNGTGGFRLRLPEDRLVHVNTDPGTLGANYPASLLVQARVEELVTPLLDSLPGEGVSSEWSREEADLWRSRIAGADPEGPPEPSTPGVPSGSVGELVGILREELPRDAVVVTDSGLHQVLVRRHFPVLAPRGLITPADFQSMGFGLPAAVGAKLAAPERVVAVVMGDGGLCMSGMELLTLAREKLPVIVFVFSDGYLNLIRLQQERDFGHGHAVRLQEPDMEALAEACGVAHVRLDADVRVRVRAAIRGEEAILVEVPLGESREMRSIRRRRQVRTVARRALGEGLVDRVRWLFGKGRPVP
jgi:acetolactate synthase I/II/III large subunit